MYANEYVNKNKTKQNKNNTKQMNVLTKFNQIDV